MNPEIVIVALVLSGLAVQGWLIRRQMHYLERHSDTPPPEYRAVIDREQHQRAIAYTLDRLRLQGLGLVLEAMLTLLWLAAGALGQLDQWLHAWLENPWLHGLALFGIVYGLNGLVALPLAWYRQFVVEQRHGFNRMDLRTFVADRLKMLLLAILLGAPLLLGLLWIMQHLRHWWLWGGLLLTVVSLLMGWLWPTLIAPLFNRFTPLPQGPLRQRIEELLAQDGFRLQGIFVMDDSRRSGHGNAYFTGFGRSKRIVFYDTLLEQLDEEQILAVLAHELGHYRHHHVLQGLLLSTLLGILLLALAAWLMQWPAFLHLSGVQQPSAASALLAFLLLLPWITVWIEPLLNAWSRRHEYQADAHAARLTRPEWLIQGLLRLYRDNASPVVTDPLYSLFHDSHPPASLRIQHLKRLQHGAST